MKRNLIGGPTKPAVIVTLSMYSLKSFENILLRIHIRYIVYNL